MIEHEGKEYGFERLFEAVRYSPEKLPEIVRDNIAVLECANYAGETVLQFFSMEGDTEKVKLLLENGAQADEWSVYFAAGFGHVDTILLLLEYGAIPDIEACKEIFLLSKPSKSKRIEVRKLFAAYDYEFKV
ncbi:MAG: ankyrin repeat domain-containing protein [Candidatus Thiodiazotropha lotti]|uniref:Ankyrin repeat domain-containing protein n=1 Tax=Candidatus Thiodiazotropha lotti TaxID=2792787 RepID=A0A9E4K4W4_9GAMM|nr:ankyrin repeat domain-containing protein [Candidatus Thiodiazotropha lotti]MCG7982672.1 ankyrin repeat domain-containing protein [Candidatus Thiodiazotropha lotti]MCW4204175.1 ankyrin repeat domain-containing protein [Candidatus Thiodiazotropha lotti]ODC01894.1 hypothetical protein A3197_05450 [Candidatus Thiodiazotropha endoloripes]